MMIQIMGVPFSFMYPDKELLPNDKEMTIFDHLEELRDRIFVSVLAVGAAIMGCFVYSKDLIMILEAPVRTQGVQFLQLAPARLRLLRDLVSCATLEFCATLCAARLLCAARYLGCDVLGL